MHIKFDLTSKFWPQKIKITLFSAAPQHASSSFCRQLSNGVKNKAPTVGLEPTTFGLEVQRAIHCATRACPLLKNVRSDVAVTSNYFTRFLSIETVII